MTAPDCHPEREHAARGLCNACYFSVRYRSRLVDHPRRLRSRDEFLDDYVLLRGEGHTQRQIAERLGMTLGAVRQAVHRARRAGDPRAFVWRAKRRTV